MSEIVPGFRVQLDQFLVASGLEGPLNFQLDAHVEGNAPWTGMVIMSAPVDSDKDVQLFTTNTVVNIPPSVRVKAGESSARFVSTVNDVAIETDVTVFAFFNSFFASPAKSVTLHVTKQPPK
jgi:hypothetical protein